MIHGLYLLDTSAVMHARAEPSLRERLDALTVAGLAATCPAIDLEVGYSAVSRAEHRKIAAVRADLLIDLPFVPEIGAAARELQAALATKSQHRTAGALDLIVAATALHYRATILHRDGDYEHIAAVSGLATERA